MICYANNINKMNNQQGKCTLLNLFIQVLQVILAIDKL